VAIGNNLDGGSRPSFADAIDHRGMLTGDRFERAD